MNNAGNFEMAGVYILLFVLNVFAGGFIFFEGSSLETLGVGDGACVCMVVHIFWAKGGI